MPAKQRDGALCAADLASMQAMLKGGAAPAMGGTAAGASGAWGSKTGTPAVFAPATQDAWGSKSALQSAHPPEPESAPTPSGGGGGSHGSSGASSPKSTAIMPSNTSAPPAPKSFTLDEVAQMHLDRFGGAPVAGRAGLRKKITRAGKGPAGLPPAGACVTVHYVTKDMKGHPIDASRQRIEKPWDTVMSRQTRSDQPPGPTTFTLGDGEVVPAWEHAVPSMVAGEVCEVLATAEHAYGESGAEHLGIPGGVCLVFELELISFKEGRKKKEGMPDDEKLALAIELKGRGTAAFKAARYEEAAALYADAAHYLSVVRDLKCAAPWKGPGPPPAQHLPSYYFGERYEEASALLLSCYLNGSQCAIKREAWRVAEKEASRALDLDAKSTKALFRRGAARAKLGEYADAKADLRRANILDPKSREIRDAFDECAAAEAEAKQAEKSFLGKGALDGYEAPAPEPKPKEFVC